MSEIVKEENGMQGFSRPSVLILNKSLSRSSFTDYLGSGFRIRESTNTPKDSVILTRSGVSLLLIYIAKIEASCVAEQMQQEYKGQQHINQESIEDVCKRVEHFHKNHQGAIIIMVSAAFGEEEIELVTSKLLQKLLPRPPLFLLAHGDAQAASHIQQIAKATLQEMRVVVKERIDQVIHKALSTDLSLNLASAMGLSSHDASVLMDTYGSIGAVANANSDAVHQNTPLDEETSCSIFDFLNKDTVAL